MLPFAIPVGTTLETLLTDVVPAAHARLVPAAAGREVLRCAFELEGASRWIIDIDGPVMRVCEGEERAVDVRIRTRAADAQVFLDDWVGPQRFVPKQRPPTDMVLMSDPRLLKRIRMVTGVIELAIHDFDAGDGPKRVAITAAIGSPAKKFEAEADVVVETSMKTYLRLLAGELGPEEALADGDVTVKGKRLVAMQFALAVGPLFPRSGV